MYISRVCEEWRHLQVPGSVLHVKVCTFRGYVKNDVICKSLGVSYTRKYVHFEGMWRMTSSASPWECLTRESMYISRVSEEWRHLQVPGSVLHMKVCTFRGCLKKNCISFQLITCPLIEKLGRLPILNHSTLGSTCSNICRRVLKSFLCKTNAKLKALRYGRTRRWHCSHPTTQRPTAATNHIHQNQNNTPYAVTRSLFSWRWA